MKRSFGYAAHAAQAALAPFHFDRRDTGPDDVRIEIAFCGVCHSDLHMARNEWNMSRYPLVPGHEIVGHVTETGANVSRFQVGQRVGVVGLGGLGHMAVKLAAAMGAEVVLFTTSPGKGDDALRLGAKQVVVSTDAAQMAA